MGSQQEKENFFRVVLVEPEIPQNTGNIGRTCVGTNSELHLIKPFGFEITDKNLKRAGLDYWTHLTWKTYENYEEWFKQVPDPSRIFFFSTKAKKTHYDAHFQKGDWLVFGKETKGLSPEIISKYPDQCYLIPQFGPIRSLNVATAVAIAAYEGIRQIR